MLDFFVDFLFVDSSVFSAMSSIFWEVSQVTHGFRLTSHPNSAILAPKVSKQFKMIVVMAIGGLVYEGNLIISGDITGDYWSITGHLS